MLHTDLIEKVRESLVGRNEVIQQLYEDFNIRKGVIGTLIKSGCNQLEAEDYFTDAVLIFVKSCLRPDFEIKSSLKNYLIGTAKFLWYKEVTKSKKKKLLDNEQKLIDERTPLVELMREERKDPLRKLLNLLDSKCKEIILLWSHKRKMRQIALDMNYKSEGMARKKKHQCMQKLYTLISDNPGLKDSLRDML